MSPTRSPVSRIDCVALIANPKSSGGGLKEAKRLKRELVKRFPKLKVELKPTKRPRHAEQLAKRIAARPRTLIVSVSGDGGYHETINGAVAGSGRRTPFCVVHGAGNANDHHEAVQDGTDLVTLLETGRWVPASLLEVSVAAGSQTTRRLAHSYVGFGITARVAERLNRRRVNPASEIGLVLAALRDHRPLTADLGRGPRRYDVLLCFNIGRMAKYLRLDSRTKLTDERFDLITITTARPWRWPLRLLRAVTIGLRPDRTVRRQAFRFPKAVPLQLDGETIACTAGATVTVRARAGAIKTLVPRSSDS